MSNYLGKWEDTPDQQRKKGLVEMLLFGDDIPEYAPEAEQLIRMRDQGTPLDPAKLGPISKPVAAIAELTQAPVEIAFQSVLATASLATQHLANVETLAGYAPLSLFLVTVAASGERKSSTDKLAIKAVQKWESDLAPIHAKAIQDHEFEMACYEAMKRKAVKDHDPETKAQVPQFPIAPIAPIKITSDFTFEGLLSHFETSNPSIGIFSDEGGQVFGGHGMNSENQLKTAAGLSKLWDAAPVNRTRAGASQVTFRNRRAALHVMIQPKIAEDVLNNETLFDQGFLSRTLIAWPQSRIGLRLIDTSLEAQAKRDQAQEQVARYNKRIAKLLGVSPSTTTDPRELVMDVLPLAADARAELVAFANTVEAAQAENGPYSHITGFASKAAEQAARIAGVLTMFNDPTTPYVNLRMMQTAIWIIEWYLNEARRLLDAGPVDPVLSEAQTLLDWLNTKCGTALFDVRYIVRYGPKSIRDTAKVKRLLSVLEQHKLVRIMPEKAMVDGKQSLNPWQLNDVA